MQRSPHTDRSTRRMRSLSNPTHPTARPMGTTCTKQMSHESFATGQQCIWPPIRRAGHQIDARCMWLSSQINVVVQSNQSRQLRRMATSHNWERQKVLSWNSWNPKRAHIFKLGRMCGPPSQNQLPWKHVTSTICEARRSGTFTLRCTMYKTPCFQIKLASSQNVPCKATNISW